jgi:hypothetical protein
MADDNFLPTLDDQVTDPYVERAIDRIQKKLEKVGLGTVWAMRIACGFGSIIVAVFYIFELAITIVAYLGTPLVTFFLRILTKLRTDTVPEQLELSASVLSEFLATEISPEQMKPGKGADATIAAANQIGGALLDRLEKEFTGGASVTPDSGAAAARTFSGYAVNFAVQNTTISTLADAISFHMLEQFRELGVEVAQNLGLGRLVRSALRPLVDTTIGKPYTRQLNAKYRQDLMGDSNIVRAMQRGHKDITQAEQELAWKGYTDADIRDLILEYTPHLTESEVFTLMRFGELSETEAIAELVAQGIPEITARRRLRAKVLNNVDSLESTYADTLEGKYTNGFIDGDTFRVLLERLHISPEEKQVRRDRAGLILDAGQRRATIAEMQQMLNEGIVTTEDVTDWLDKQNYATADQLPLLYLFLSKFDAAQASKAAKTQHDSHNQYKHLTLTQIAKYYKEQLLQDADVVAYVRDLGYDAATTQILIATILYTAGNSTGAQAARARAAQLTAQIPEPPSA